GRLHAEGGGAKESPKFLVPNAVLSPEKADFDLSVDEARLADVVLMKGRYRLRARLDKLDLDRITSWWAGP
ncbi:MAG TPA: hypothetical protein VNI01_13245, partial [Elusimicrobiota bacterium]|nr:hypothetical protein [Elusimicrobiota bacterium]